MDFKFNLIANDTTTFDFTLTLVSSSHLDSFEKDYESIPLMGRNDNLIIDHGTFKNKTHTDKCYLQAPNGLYKATKDIRNWLQGGKGYKILEYNDGAKYNAIVKGKIEFKELFDNVAEVTINYEVNEVIT